MTKQIKLGVVMDSIAGIKPYKDTTFAMILEAQARGHSVHYFEIGDLGIRDGRAYGRSRTVDVVDRNADYYTLGDPTDLWLDELDAILMRKDPPVDSEYLYATYILDLAERAGTLVVNKPQALRDANEKLFATHFPQCSPPTLISRDAGALRRFLDEHGKAVLKPLHGMGGASIFVLASGDPNTSVVLETLTAQGSTFALAQRYLPEIKSGDKRILLIDGEPIPYALARIPATGETRGNLAAGGRGEGVELSDRDRWICEQVGPTLREKGLMFVGLDVIGDYLTEINVTSPTCVRELDKIYGINISARLFDLIEQRLSRPG